MLQTKKQNNAGWKMGLSYLWTKEKVILFVHVQTQEENKAQGLDREEILSKL